MRQRRRNSTHHMPPLKLRGGAYIKFYTESRTGISARFMRVQIENKDFREIIKQYDRPKTFFYLDPPYVGDTRKSPKVYAHEMVDKDHQDLVDLLLNLKG